MENDMITLQPIAIVHNQRAVIEDDQWGGVISTLELLPPLDATALAGLADFSHVEVIFFFDQVAEHKIERGARHPRNNPAWPKVGILAQRGKNRPNRLGVTIARIVQCAGRTLVVEGLDALDGTPVLDIKPVLQEFLPRGAVRQPVWATELMRNYWEQWSP
jgi:tRNA-Thr(GGU) m(6)t(6)A37 methyltransferase TsaA